MNEEEKQAFAAELIAQITEAITPIIDQKNSGLAAALERKFEKKYAAAQQPAESTDGEEQPQQQRLTMAALQSQIQQLQADLEAKANAEVEARRNAAIASAVAAVPGILQPSLVQRLIKDDYGKSIKAEGDAWFYEGADGTVQPLGDLLKSFLSSETGQFFVSPSGVPGSGSKESKRATPQPQKELTIDEQYAQLVAAALPTQ